MADATPARHEPFDHGMLNIPLAKRQGNIDARIDRYKAEQAAIAKREATAAYKAHGDAMKTVRRLVAGLSAERLAALGAPHQLSPAKTREMLLSIGRSNPERAIRALSKEAA